MELFSTSHGWVETKGVFKRKWWDGNWCGSGVGLSLGESNGDWGWLIDDQVLQVASGNVFTTEGEHTVLIRFLGESDSDWRWLVDNEVLEVTSGDVLTSESEHTVLIGFLGESNGDWRWLINNKVLKVTSGDIFTAESEHTIGIGFHFT